MSRLLAIAAVAVGIALIQGCAYLTTYTRPLDLRDQSYSMDVKQRIVISQRKPTAQGANPTTAATVVCAEPSPDALTVIGVSGGLSLNSERADITGNLGGGLSENGAFVGLRTHSIQLLRDAMYRLCEGYAGGAINELTFQSMQRRYQSTMMGLIAIEQLTGPVVAAQALLTTNATSEVGAAPGDAAVTKAQERADAATDAVLAAQEKLDESDAKVAAELKNSQAADKALAEQHVKKDPDKATIDELTANATAAKEDLAAARRAREASRRSLAVAQDRSRQASQDLRAARSRVSATAAGAGRLGDVSGAISASNASLATGVVEIVKEINGSYLRDSCFSFTSDLLRDPELLKKLQGLQNVNTSVSPVRMVRAMIDTCEEVINIDAVRLLKASGASEATVANFRDNAMARSQQSRGQ